MANLIGKRAGTLRASVEGMRALGLDVEAILQAADLSAEALAGLEGVVPHETVERVWVEASRRFGRPHLPLHVGLAMPLGAFEVIDYVAISANTVGEGFEAVARFFSLVLQNIAFVIEPHTYQQEVQLVAGAAGVTPAPRTIELTWAMMATRFRVHGHPDFLADELVIPYAPADAAAFAPLARRLRVAAGPSRLRIANGAWALPLMRKDERLHGVLRRHACDLLASARLAPDDVLTPVREAVVRHLQDASFGIDIVARDLGVAPRTLQRRLRERGVHFKGLVDALRQAIAREQLRATRHSVEEVAFLLGYSDGTAFARAFRRWTGTTPQQYRRQAPEDGANCHPSGA